MASDRFGTACGLAGCGVVSVCAWEFLVFEGACFGSGWEGETFGGERAGAGGD